MVGFDFLRALTNNTIRFAPPLPVAERPVSQPWSSVMSRATIRHASVIAVLLAVAVTLSSCGRRGGLESPPSAAVLTTDETGAAVKTKVDRPFILDGLL